jgi:pantetheine-phosphate adenylyltransferase
MPRTAFYPGSFDPVTFGHLDIIARVARICDRLVLGVGAHHGKQPLIPTPERVRLLAEVARPVADQAGVLLDIVVFEGLAVDAAHKAKAGLIVRGLRDATDFDYEVQMGQMNAALAPDIETVFLAASAATRMIASSLVKQIAQMGGDVSLFVPPQAEQAIRQALKTPV